MTQGVFLTHLHMGHYIGLHHLGKEAMQASLPLGSALMKGSVGWNIWPLLARTDGKSGELGGGGFGLPWPLTDG